MRVFLPLALLAACSGDDEKTTDTGAPEADTDTDTDADSDSDPDTGEAWTGSAATVDNGDGTFTTTVDATHEELWTWFDLASGASVVPADASTSADWDLGFRRERIALDGGASGAGGVEVARLDHVPFDAVRWPASGGYVTDTPDADADGFVESPLAAWYDYDPATHRLSPADLVWVVRDRVGATWRLRFDGYYDATDAAGHPAFTWGPLTEPSPLATVRDVDGTVTATITAPSDTDPIHLRLAPELALEPSDPAASDAWDLSVARTVVTLGTAGGVEVAPVAGAWGDVAAAPTDGWSAAADALAAWYDYDPATHAVSAKAQVWAVRTSDGAVLALQFLTYDDGVITARWAGMTP